LITGKIIVGVCVGVGGFLVVLVVCCVCWHRQKKSKKEGVRRVENPTLDPDNLYGKPPVAYRQSDNYDRPVSSAGGYSRPRSGLHDSQGVLSDNLHVYYTASPDYDRLGRKYYNVSYDSCEIQVLGTLGSVVKSLIPLKPMCPGSKNLYFARII
jgi:hypothetical protein